MHRFSRQLLCRWPLLLLPLAGLGLVMESGPLGRTSCEHVPWSQNCLNLALQVQLGFIDTSLLHDGQYLWRQPPATAISPSSAASPPHPITNTLWPGFMQIIPPTVARIYVYTHRVRTYVDVPLQVIARV